MRTGQRWLNREDFQEALGSDQLPAMEPLAMFEVSRSEILEFTGLEVPLESEPFEAPGPCFRWFGQTASIAAVITNYVGNTPLTELAVTKDYSFRRAFVDLSLPSDFLRKLLWLKGSREATCSVFTFDKDDLQYELYRADSPADAEELIEYLEGCGFAKQLDIMSSEDLDQQWVIIENDREIGRFPSRYMASQFAMTRSKTSHGQATVFSLKEPGQTEVFNDGRPVARAIK
jgi:hypothetical protein